MRRRRNNRDTYADVQVTVSAEPGLRGPALKDLPVVALLDGYEPMVLRAVSSWWDTWRASPQAEAFLDTDWGRLQMLIPLVASYYARPHYTKLAEIRQSETLLGATHVDRLRARIKVEVEKAPAVLEGVTALDDYRARLSV